MLSITMVLAALITAIVANWTRRPHVVLSIAVVLIALALLLGPVIRMP